MNRRIHTMTLPAIAATLLSFGADVEAQQADAALHIENIGAAPERLNAGQLDEGDLKKAPGQRHSWSYEQTPSREEQVAAAIQRRAEIRGQQRALRLAAQKWYGVSNARPTVTPTSWSSSYRPTWEQRRFQRFAWYYVLSRPAAPIAPPTITR